MCGFLFVILLFVLGTIRAYSDNGAWWLGAISVDACVCVCTTRACKYVSITTQRTTNHMIASNATIPAPMAMLVGVSSDEPPAPLPAGASVDAELGLALEPVLLRLSSEVPTPCPGDAVLLRFSS